MKLWSRLPVFRVLIPFSVGILVSIYSNLPVNWHFLFLPVAIFCTWIFTNRKYATGRFADRWLAGIPFYLSFYLLGFALTWIIQPSHFSDHFPLQQQEVSCIIELSGQKDSTRSGFRLYAKVTAYRMNHEWKSCRGNLLIFLLDSSHKFNGKRGDKLLIRAAINKINPPANPEAFNYARYMRYKGFSYQCFISDASFIILETCDKFSIFNVAKDFQTRMLSVLTRYIRGSDRLGVAGALLLGYDDWLDPDLEKNYAAAGVLHILCVSGMHVGLIYVILGWLLQFMDKSRWTRMLKIFMLVAFVWFYALVTGFAPSVVRASAMISIVIFGKWIGKKAGISNILCTMCMLLFIVDPFLLTNAGFQLSFLAVCGIVFLHKIILPVWRPANKLVFRVWELMSVSISAQLATFPLSIYLFHQFPNYFIIGNLLIIPLSTLIMYSGIFLLATDWIPIVGNITGHFLSAVIDVLNFFVKFVSSLPGSVSENIYVTFSESLLFFLIVILVPAWLVLKSRVLLFATLSSLIVLLMLRISNLTEANQNEILTVYQIRKSSVYSFSNGRSVLILKDTMASDMQMNFGISSHILSLMPKHTDINNMPEGGIIKLNGWEEAVFIKNWSLGSVPAYKSKPDSSQLLIMGGKITAIPDTILAYFRPEKVIFDASCRPWEVNKMKSVLNSHNIPFHDVSQSGAFVFRRNSD